jgi:hypothetical protein
MSEMPKSLFAALAVLQADLPKIAKGETAQVKSDKGNYSYKYADLADVSQHILPRLSAVGLAFTSRPTLIDGQFVLAYSLTHLSGEREDGVYPLPSTGSPQQIGSAITYARRYSLCAVTGAAPDSDDDDAAGAEHSHRQSAADAFEQAAPARPQQQRPQAARTPTAESDANWLDLIGKEIDKIRTREDGVKVWSQIGAAFSDGTCSAADRKALEAQTAAKISAIKGEEAAA